MYTYKDAGGQQFQYADPVINRDAIKSQNLSYVSGGTGDPLAPTVSPISTPSVISSKDLASSFASNSSSLTGKTPQTFTTPSGAVVDAQGNLISAPGAGDQGKTPVEKGAAAGAGSEDKPSVSTGDPLYDALQSWEKEQGVKNAAAEEEKKAQVKANLTTNLANTDAAYAAQIQSIQNTYAGLIETQTRLNNLNIARTKAYGLASGNAMSTPLEFTNAVSLKEQDAMNAIQKLDDSRDNLIATARAAQASADAKLLQDSMASIDKIESDMAATAASIAKEVTDRYAVLQTIETQQKADLKTKADAFLAAQTLQYVDAFGNSKDNTAKDTIVKNIVTASGGLLDYGTVLAKLTGAVQAKTDATTKATQDKADLAYKLAQTGASMANSDQSKASTAKTWQEVANMQKGLNADGTPNGDKTLSSVSKYLQPGQKFPDGTPVLAPDGKLTSDAFDRLSTAPGMDRTKFLTQYGSLLQPGSDNKYSQYNLTGAEVKKLTGATPIYIPPSTQ
jgi:hypothetical protein